MWQVVATNEFEEWFGSLSMAEREDVDASILLLRERGIALGRPHSSGINDSKFGRMRELRIQHAGNPYRVFYAFDPKRRAVLLIGGIKTNEKRFYKKYIPIADRLYEEHLGKEN